MQTNPRNNPQILVCGAGGFIGGHLVRYLLEHGYNNIRAVDLKPLNAWSQTHREAENLVLDLRDADACLGATRGARIVYNLAADTGGVEFTENHKARSMLSVLINTHLLQAARIQGVERFFYASSAGVYANGKQALAAAPPLVESDAYPAMPEDGHGWEKLFSERMCRHFREDFGLQTRVARYHNIYGPLGTWDGGRENAPAAICRKVIEAKLSGSYSIEIWGDGEQTRSFTYIDDCLKGTVAILKSGILEPVNLGNSETVSINQLVDIVEEIAHVRVNRTHRLDAPAGVRGRKSDNTLIKDRLGWEPSIQLREGLEKTYRWIYDEIIRKRFCRRTSYPVNPL